MLTSKNIYCFLLIFILHLQGVLSACDANVISGIDKFWNKKPPTNIIPRYEGTWTIIKINLKDTGVHDELKCFMEGINSKEKSSKYYVFFSNSKNDFTTDMKISEKPGIVVKDYTMDNAKVQDLQYVLYFDQGVMAFWLCSDGQESMSAIAVKDYAKTANDPKTKEAIQKGEDSLKKAGLPNVQGIHTECPANPAAGAVKKTK